MLDPLSPDHYRLPKCIVCDERVGPCLAVSGKDVPECVLCIRSIRSGRPNIKACQKCGSAAGETALCFAEHCSEGRKGQDGECTDNCEIK